MLIMCADAVNGQNDLGSAKQNNHSLLFKQQSFFSVVYFILAHDLERAAADVDGT